MYRSVRHSHVKEMVCIIGRRENTASDWCRPRLPPVLIGVVSRLYLAGWRDSRKMLHAVINTSLPNHTPFARYSISNSSSLGMHRRECPAIETLFTPLWAGNWPKREPLMEAELFSTTPRASKADNERVNRIVPLRPLFRPQFKSLPAILIWKGKRK